MLAIDSTSDDRTVAGLTESKRRVQSKPHRDEAKQDPNGRWLSINAACEILGVDKSTLRRWSDSGRVPVFRTPGGHRRYSEVDLKAFLSGESVPGRRVNRRELAAITRDEFKRRNEPNGIEHYSDAQESADWTEELRQTHDRMIDLSIRYASGRGDPERLLVAARQLAQDYGRCTAHAKLETSEAVDSFLRFRRPLLDGLGRYVEKQNLPVRRSCRMIAKLNAYLDIMLTSLVEAHEAFPVE
jgi:excisionase family DNA binding protein